MKADHHIHMVLDGVYWRDAIARHSRAVDKQFVREQLDIYQKAGFNTADIISKINKALKALE